ncbi:MAG: protein-glutamate O-methyltransferase CheR [Deltaproteobacteria bacterium]|nr:protein-glutamate O-methyltransferase CheR [Deltaproteobacteria bacterium]
MRRLLDGGPDLGAAEHRLIAEAVNAFCGLHLGRATRFLMQRRLRERLESLSLPDFAAYYRYLRYDRNGAAEMERAVEILTTNETYFFREDYQLRAFVNEVLPGIAEDPALREQHRLVVWSAGCSTGEEAYSLAMLIDDSGLFPDWDIRIIGSDISRRVIERAREGVYGASSFRAMPPQYLHYFDEVSTGRRVSARIRAMCHFGHLNLLDSERAAVVGRVHAVFCRNVLIYFDEESRRRVIEGFYERLLPGGTLLLGHSESLLNLSTRFELLHLSTDMVYRRPSVTASLQRKTSQ